MLNSSLKFLVAFLLVIVISPKSEAEAEYEQWCVADEQIPDNQLQVALNWACGKGGANCSNIQIKGPCYMPNTVRDHANYAFNNYFQKFKHKGASCYFNGASITTELDPSHGSCHFEFLP